MSAKSIQKAIVEGASGSNAVAPFELSNEARCENILVLHLVALGPQSVCRRQDSPMMDIEQRKSGLLLELQVGMPDFLEVLEGISGHEERVFRGLTLASKLDRIAIRQPSAHGRAEGQVQHNRPPFAAIRVQDWAGREVPFAGYPKAFPGSAAGQSSTRQMDRFQGHIADRSIQCAEASAEVICSPKISVEKGRFVTALRSRFNVDQALQVNCMFKAHDLSPRLVGGIASTVQSITQLYSVCSRDLLKTVHFCSLLLRGFFAESICLIPDVFEHAIFRGRFSAALGSGPIDWRAVM